MSESSRGGKREGAGRKPKADEIKMVQQMDAIMMPDHVWSALSFKVIDGDVQAIKTWLSYRFGMPKQIIEHKEEKEVTEIRIVRADGT